MKRGEKKRKRVQNWPIHIGDLLLTWVRVHEDRKRGIQWFFGHTSFNLTSFTLTCLCTSQSPDRYTYNRMATNPWSKVPCTNLGASLGLKYIVESLLNLGIDTRIKSYQNLRCHCRENVLHDWSLISINYFIPFFGVSESFSKLSSSKRRKNSREGTRQCDQISRLCFQYLAIYSYEIFTKRIHIVPKWAKTFPKTK